MKVFGQPYGKDLLPRHYPGSSSCRHHNMETVMIWCRFVAPLFLAAACLGSAASAAQAPGFTILNRVAGPDGKWDPASVDAAHRRRYVARGDGTVRVITLAGAAPMTVSATIVTQLRAHTGAVDPLTGKLYLPTARVSPAASSSKPERVPGIFEILVVGQP
jgi:hypothetical protein